MKSLNMDDWAFAGPAVSPGINDVFPQLLAFPQGASTASDEVDCLHVFVIAVTMLMSTYVFAAAAWFTVRYHRKRERQLTPRITASVSDETLVIVGILGIFLLWWIIGYRQYIEMTRDP